MKRVAIVQSNYIPWKGYFDLIAAVDEFILFDDVQFTRRDWRNRNLIKTPQGLQWLTVPVQSKGQREQLIRDVRLQPGEWAATHWKTLVSNYRRAPWFDRIAALLQPLYGQRHDTLSALNRAFITAICRYLGIGTRLTSSSDYRVVEGKTLRLAELCRQAGGDVYVSGPSARAYLDEAVLKRMDIRLEWFDYSGYPEYPQLWGAFEHGVSVLDLMFNCGTESPRYMKHVRR